MSPFTTKQRHPAPLPNIDTAILCASLLDLDPQPRSFHQPRHSVALSGPSTLIFIPTIQLDNLTTEAEILRKFLGDFLIILLPLFIRYYLPYQHYFFVSLATGCQNGRCAVSLDIFLYICPLAYLAWCCFGPESPLHRVILNHLMREGTCVAHSKSTFFCHNRLC